MTILRTFALAALCGLVFACGGGEPPTATNPEPASPAVPAQGSPESAEAVRASVVRTCAGEESDFCSAAYALIARWVAGEISDEDFVQGIVALRPPSPALEPTDPPDDPEPRGRVEPSGEGPYWTEPGTICGWREDDDPSTPVVEGISIPPCWGPPRFRDRGVDGLSPYFEPTILPYLAVENISASCSTVEIRFSAELDADYFRRTDGGHATSWNFVLVVPGLLPEDCLSEELWSSDERDRHGTERMRPSERGRLYERAKALH